MINGFLCLLVVPECDAHWEARDALLSQLLVADRQRLANVLVCLGEDLSTILVSSARAHAERLAIRRLADPDNQALLGSFAIREPHDLVLGV